MAVAPIPEMFVDTKLFKLHPLWVLAPPWQVSNSHGTKYGKITCWHQRQLEGLGGRREYPQHIGTETPRVTGRFACQNNSFPSLPRTLKTSSETPCLLGEPQCWVSQCHLWARKHTHLLLAPSRAPRLSTTSLWQWGRKDHELILEAAEAALQRMPFRNTLNAFQLNHRSHLPTSASKTRNPFC